MLWHTETTLAKLLISGAEEGRSSGIKASEKLERHQEGKGENAVRGQVVCSTQRVSSEDRRPGAGVQLSKGSGERWGSLEVDSREEQDADGLMTCPLASHCGTLHLFLFYI